MGGAAGGGEGGGGLGGGGEGGGKGDGGCCASEEALSDKIAKVLKRAHDDVGARINGVLRVPAARAVLACVRVCLH